MVCARGAYFLCILKWIPQLKFVSPSVQPGHNPMIFKTKSWSKLVLDLLRSILLSSIKMSASLTWVASLLFCL